MSAFRIPLLIAAFVLMFLPDAMATELPGNGLLQVVDLQLRWKHQFQFAGYYAAIEQGYYRDAGLEVRLHEGGPGRVPVDEVLAGRAQYAAGNSEVLYGRLKGHPLVALAAIFQHSASVLLVRGDSGIRTPHDLVGKKVMLMNGRHDSDFHAMFLREGIRTEGIDILPTSYEVDDLISGRVDAFNSYLTNEPYALAKQGIGYVVINPSHYGIDYYGDILFTTENELKLHPARVEAMRTATLRGWQYAMAHPDEIIDLLIKRYGVGKERAHLEFESAAMRSLILPDLVEIGHMNPGRWQAMADAFKLTGMVDRNANLDGFIYDPDPPLWEGRIRRIVTIFGAVIAAVLAVVLSMLVVQNRLRREIALRKGAEERLSHLNALLQHTGRMAKVGGWELDIENNRHTWTDEAAHIREIAPGTVLTYEQALSLYDPEDRPNHLAYKKAAIEHGTPWEHESPLTTAKGKRVWVHSRGYPVVRDGRTVLLTGTLQDITDRKLAELALARRSRELEMHNQVLRQINQGMSMVETLDSMTRQIEALHPGMRCAVSLLDAEAKRLQLCAAPSMPDHHKAAIERLVVADGTCASCTAAFRGERVIVEDVGQHPYFARYRDEALQNGLRSVWAQPVKDHAGGVLGVFAAYLGEIAIPNEDELVLLETYASLAALVIERDRSETQIRNLAYFDTLTRLPNRRLLDDRLSLAMAVSKRSGRYGALMFIDLDNFKPLNDMHGHGIGDLLLIQVASRISGCVREMDTVARFGGDEFVVMLCELDADKAESAAQASRVAEKIRGALAAPYRLTGKPGETIEHRCTASIGVVLFANHEASLEEIIKWADLEMYRAKDEGRDRVCLAMR